MSNYSDDYKDQKAHEFMRRWCPSDKPLPEISVTNMRWNVARANAAEAELTKLKDALKVLKDALR